MYLEIFKPIGFSDLDALNPRKIREKNATTGQRVERQTAILSVFLDLGIANLELSGCMTNGPRPAESCKRVQKKCVGQTGQRKVTRFYCKELRSDAISARRSSNLSRLHVCITYTFYDLL